MALLSGGGSAAYKSLDRTSFTATAGQTTFTVTQGYSVGDVDVYMNGIKLVEGDDYYATTGTTIILVSAANLGDSLQVISYNQFSAANAYTKTESDTRYMVANGGTPMTSYLRTPNYGVSSYSDTASASLEASAGSGTQGVGVKAWGRSMPTWGGDMHYITDTRGASGQHRFYGWNGSTWTQNLSIDSLGRMNVSNQPAFSAYSMTNETTAANSPAPYTATRYNIGGHFNTSTRTFTAPVAGRYLFTHFCNANGISTGSGIYAAFYVNGVQRSAYMYCTVANTWTNIVGTAVLNLNASDTVFVAPALAFHFDYGSLAWGQFDGYLLG
jgi:hypothetical protein